MSEGVYYFPVTAQNGRKYVGKGLGPYHPAELAARVSAMSTLKNGQVSGSLTATEVYSARGDSLEQAKERVRSLIDRESQ